MHRYIFRILSLVTLSLFFTYCGESTQEIDSPEEIPAEYLDFPFSGLYVEVGQSHQVEVTLRPDNTTDKVYWSSGNPSIASIDESGIVTGISVGETTITASAGDLTVSCPIEVALPYVPVSNIILNFSDFSMNVGDITTVHADVYPANASEPYVFWSSSDSEIAIINREEGKIVALKEGTVTITCEAANPNIKKTFTLSVLPPKANSIAVKYYSCQIFDDHVDINVFADNRIYDIEGSGLPYVMDHWKLWATEASLWFVTEMTPSDGASFPTSSTSSKYGKYCHFLI